MREIVVIGVGAGDPEQVTMQAVSALNRVDVFFVLDKGEVKQELVDLRSEILRRYATDKDYRIVVGQDPERDRTTSAYVEAVDDWRRRRADVCASLIGSELGEGQVGAFLVWGDPSLYDSTLAILDDILARGELEDYHLAHSARADLCRRLGRTAEARTSYERALELTKQEPERRFLGRRLEELEANPRKETR